MIPFAIQPTDIALFLVSFAACIYCMVLSRRLKALQDTRDGLGATIMAMSKSVAAVSSATQETKAHAGELATRLTALMQEADRTCARLSDLTQSMEDAHSRAARHANETRTELETTLRDLLFQSKERTVEMKTQLRQMRSVTSAAASTLRDSDFLFEDDDVPARKRSA